MQNNKLSVAFGFLSTFLLFNSCDTQAKSIENVRGSRYCEIIYSKYSLTLPVYSTYKLNDCPQSIWDKVSIEGVKKSTGANRVILNGPRYFMMDGIISSEFKNKKVEVLDGLPMRIAGKLKVSIKDVLLGFVPYREHTVERNTKWVYNAGRPVYELIDPKGRVFVLQSYSVEVKPQKEASLASLGNILKIPHGWSFKTGLLKKEGEVSTIKKQAIVIQDELKNTYQMAADDLL